MFKKKQMNTLQEIVIGKQIWMAHNLCVTQFQNGDPIDEVKTKEDWENAGMEGKPAYCYYNNIPENEKNYGVLYNWFTLADQRGIVPDGWRIPTNADWDELIEYLGGNRIAGKKMKAPESWMTKDNGESGNGSNESAFNAYPGGHRNFIGQFHRFNLSCSWWSAYNHSDKTNWFYYLDYNSDKIEKGIADLEDGLSIRLIKNS